jgi:hypothetical protein
LLPLTRTCSPAATFGPCAIHSLSPSFTRPLPCSIAWTTVAVSPTSRAPRRFISGSALSIGLSRRNRRTEKAMISERNTKSITCSGSDRSKAYVSTPVMIAAAAIQIR